jgi:hypothetical protein
MDFINFECNDFAVYLPIGSFGLSVDISGLTHNVFLLNSEDTIYEIKESEFLSIIKQIKKFKGKK